MTLFRRQFIPVLRWAYFVADEDEMNAIVNPIEGAIANVEGVGLFQYVNGNWVPIFSTSNCGNPLTLFFVYKNDGYSGNTLELTGYDWPDPSGLSEENGNFIFELFINGVKQMYKETPTDIGEFGISDTLPGLIFPYTLDFEKIQFKALIL